MRSGNVSACVGAAGKLFVDTSASKCLNNGALLGASRKMNCKESGCLVHIKTTHRQKQREKGLGMIHISFLHYMWHKVVCIREVCFTSLKKSDPSQKSIQAPSILSRARWHVVLDLLPSLPFLFSGSLMSLAGIFPDFSAV